MPNNLSIRCACDHRAPPLRILCSAEHNRCQAQEICAWNLSGDGTVDRVVSELLDHHSGRLFGPDGKSVMLDSDKSADIECWDSLFSEDQRRWMNRYKERANGAYKNRIQQRMVYPAMMVGFAIAIRACRLTGRCAAK